ncbi:hypothetical protein THMIRHAS_02280 [Thiosulfatimonas sediminis]|uniref:AdoMet activation domain-containing protein n=1 Tax=Thiosulfatimonas sediminis TaxID=2675054 RepID=A0A6F8PRW1_9GAMM|nr:nucleotidyltransferase substrate binding protein [Thiosulfatimonas sediminis]BBP44855.1 hypothetical protein THMIRHAS_02280 [Thiosulfatimonas sediminis]
MRIQVEDYVHRKGWSIEEAEKWLAPNLGYDPERFCSISNLTPLPLEKAAHQEIPLKRLQGYNSNLVSDNKAMPNTMTTELDFSSLEKAIARLDESLHLVSAIEQEDTPLYRTLISGVIQHFEFTYELSWKFMKRWLGENLGASQVDGVSRRELFRLAAEYQLIVSVDDWMLFHRARNETSHTYHEHKALEVFAIAKAFLPQAEQLLQRLKAKY